MPTLTKSLLNDLAECRWFCMKRLADEAEDRGDLESAAGWRYLAENKKWPGHDAGKYHWCFKSGNGDFYSEDEDVLILENFLKVTSLSKTFCQKLSKYDGNLIKFLSNTAKVLGKYLLKNQERKQR